MSGVWIAPVDEMLGEALDAMDKMMRAYTEMAARGECSWVCADCCCTFSAGMPDACVHGHQACTDIITRDKTDAKRAELGGKA